MAEDSEQNRTEQATQFKLRRAREQGMVARGPDLAFVAALLGLAAFVFLAGAHLIATLAVEMRRALSSGVATATDPAAASGIAAHAVWSVVEPLALLGGTVAGVILLVEVVQLRGIVFSAAPLRPDVSRLNPAAGLKRLLSAATLKQAAKSILKMTVYTVVAVLIVRGVLAGASARITDAATLAHDAYRGAVRLLLLFAACAAALAVIDQLLARGEFGKRMRMSKREVRREHKEREGDPRLKAKRKQIHAAYVKQAKGLADLPGSDLMIVNPRHVALALAYRPGEHAAPLVTAMGADRHALQLKAAAARLGIPRFESPALARALLKDCEPGREIDPRHYHAVAELYLKRRRDQHA